MTLRVASAADGHAPPPPFDATLDSLSPGYLEENAWGVPHLDAQSWRYYLSAFLEHAARNRDNGASMAVGQFLFSLRPDGRTPYRFAALGTDERGAVIAVLDDLAFGAGSAWVEDARSALEEYWGPGASYEA